jgi:hypothetical protein
VRSRTPHTHQKKQDFPTESFVKQMSVSTMSSIGFQTFLRRTASAVPIIGGRLMDDQRH